MCIFLQGTYAELVSRPGSVFSELAKDLGKTGKEKETSERIEEDRKIEEGLRKRKHLLSQTSHCSSTVSHEDFDDRDDPNQVLIVPEEDEEQRSNAPDAIASRSGRLIQEEEAMEGKVRWSVFLDYMRVIGRCYSGWILVFFAVGQLLHVSSTAWLSAWCDENAAAGDANVDPVFHLGVFAGVGVAETAVAFTRQVLLYLGCARASRVLHHRLLRRVLRSPMSFFDTTPSGRIANRVSADLDVADESLPPEITDFLWCTVELISTVIIISYATPTFVAVVAFLAATFALLVYYYIGTSRQLRRLESISRSPILSHFQETLAGADSIRGYGCQDRFAQGLEDKLSENVKCAYLGATIKFWLGTRTELLASLIVFSSSLLAVLASRGGRLSGGLAGMSVSYAFEVMEALTWMVFMACNLETNTVCLERIMEYWNLPQEAAWERVGDDVEEDDRGEEEERRPCLVPTDGHFNVQDGKIEFSGYSVRYRGVQALLFIFSCAWCASKNLFQSFFFPVLDTAKDWILLCEKFL